MSSNFSQSQPRILQLKVDVHREDEPQPSTSSGIKPKDGSTVVVQHGCMDDSDSFDFDYDNYIDPHLVGELVTHRDYKDSNGDAAGLSIWRDTTRIRLFDEEIVISDICSDDKVIKKQAEPDIVRAPPIETPSHGYTQPSLPGYNQEQPLPPIGYDYRRPQSLEQQPANGQLSRTISQPAVFIVVKQNACSSCRVSGVFFT